MAIAEQPQPITAEQFASLDAPRWSELVRGHLVEMPPPGAPHGKVQFRLAARLGRYLDDHPIGEGFTETGFMVARSPDVVRAPDVAFVRRERLDRMEPVTGYFDGAPDLAIEIVSPHDKVVDLDAKVTEYFAAGAGAVWIVLQYCGQMGTTRRVIALTSEKLARSYSADDVLDGGEVLPGFVLPLVRLFD